MSFKAFDQIYDRFLELPAPEGCNGGQPYRIPEGDTEVGAWCVRAFTAAGAVAAGQGLSAEDAPQLVFDGDDELALQRRLLSSEVLDRMRADGLGKPSIDFYVKTVFFWHAAGKELAEAYWNSGGDSLDFLRQRNRAQVRAAARASTNTGAASTTKRRGSTSGTTRRKTS